jgi:hypothetical protein
MLKATIYQNILHVKILTLQRHLVVFYSLLVLLILLRHHERIGKLECSGHFHVFFFHMT